MSSISSDIPKITLSLPSHKKENKQAELLSHMIVNKRKINTVNNAAKTSASTLISSTDTSFNKITESDSDDDSDKEERSRRNALAKQCQKPKLFSVFFPASVNMTRTRQVSARRVLMTMMMTTMMEIWIQVQ